MRVGGNDPLPQAAHPLLLCGLDKAVHHVPGAGEREKRGGWGRKIACRQLRCERGRKMR